MPPGVQGVKAPPAYPPGPAYLRRRVIEKTSEPKTHVNEVYACASPLTRETIFSHGSPRHTSCATCGAVFKLYAEAMQQAQQLYAEAQLQAQPGYRIVREVAHHPGGMLAMNPLGPCARCGVNWVAFV